MDWYNWYWYYLKYKFYLLSRFTTSYNIVWDMAPQLQRLKRALNASNYYAQRPQNSCFHPKFRCFFPFFGLICAKQNFSIRCKLRRICVISWPFRDWKWQKHGPTDGSRAICKDFSRQYEVEFLSLKREPTFHHTLLSFSSNVLVLCLKRYQEQDALFGESFPRYFYWTPESS